MSALVFLDLINNILDDQGVLDVMFMKHSDTEYSVVLNLKDGSSIKEDALSIDKALNKAFSSIKNKRINDRNLI